MSPRQYWTVLREDRWIIAGILLVCLLGALLLDLFLPRTYTSSAVFYVASSQAEPSPTDAYSGQQLATERVKSYSEVLKGPRVARDASLLLGGAPSAEEIQGAVTASYVEETVVLTLDVTERSPDQARLVAGAVSTAFTRLVGSIESTGGVVNQPIATAEVILPPTEPTEPSGPPTTIIFGGALVLGLVLGVGTALIRRSLRDTVDTPEALAQRLDAPLLGAVPALRRPPEHPALLAEPALGADGRQARLLRSRAEAYRRIRTALLSSGGGRRAVVLTGAGPGQGTSTAAVDLAIALAATGDSVVLLEADLRRPRLAATLGLRGGIGLRDVLERGRDLDAAVQRFARGRIDVITAGEAGEGPGEPLVGARLGTLLAALRARYDHVLVDTPPVTDAADAADVARHTDGVVLVCRRGRARATDIDVAASALALGGATVLGAVITWAAGVREAATTARPVLALPPGPSARPAELPAASSPVAPEPPATAPAADAAPTDTAQATDAPIGQESAPRMATTRTRTPRTRTPKTAESESEPESPATSAEAPTTRKSTTRKTPRKTPATTENPTEALAESPAGTGTEPATEPTTGEPAPRKAKRTTGSRTGTSSRGTGTGESAAPAETPTARVRPRRTTTNGATTNGATTGNGATSGNGNGTGDDGQGLPNGTSASSTNGHGI
ncbi:tyrosine-protein kinase domain-containing protein [Actinomycetospora sp. C-140]